jgi:NTE family protein
VMFLDHLATDVEHLDRLNKLLQQGKISQAGIPDCETMRPLATLLVTPSVDLSELARQHQKDMPYLIQYFVNGLGRDAVACSDLMSYLLFTPKYTRALIDIGYRDASDRIDEIEDFIFAMSNGNGSRPGKGSASTSGATAKRSSNSPRSTN